MNYQGKNKLYMSIALTALLIVMSIVVYIVKAEARPALTVLSPVMILMALIAVYISFSQVQRIKMRVQRLPPEYQSEYINAHELVGTYGTSWDDQDGIMTMILEIFEHANLEGREVHEVVGNSLPEFVERFITETGVNISLLWILSYSTFLFVGFLLLIKSYLVVRTGQISLVALESEEMELGLVISYFVIAYIIVPWILTNIKRATKYHWKGAQRIQLIVPLIIPVGLFTGLIVVDDPKLLMIVRHPVPILTNVWSVGLGLLILMGSLHLARLKKKP